VEIAKEDGQAHDELSTSFHLGAHFGQCASLMVLDGGIV